MPPELRTNCERCDKILPAEPHEARACPEGCTFCTDCADTVLRGACPNCGGLLQPRAVHA